MASDEQRPIDIEWRAELKRLIAKHDLQGAVIIAIRRDGVVDAHTYGEDKFKCDALGTWITGFAERALPVIPFQTVFGWRNGGLAEHVPDDTKVPDGWEQFR
ncbi:hypothetical protein [Rhodopseudomonas sp. BR0G17]|uniref:hypothetical protein n=1 Tax=Rhodopseudomonas sp. BR0G17 TaxID=2269368 RepID=UPI0013E0D82A|nr:hypothetical protein [Rhodopseudomonas sp. BR0G17]NEW96666.1 hypothetical protein [Rhodopseudomonas sp. BR0G17]